MRFLERIQEDSEGSFPVTPKNGSYVIGASNGISALFAILIMANFGRRPILIAGEATMAIFTFMTALGISQVWGMLSFVTLNLFLFSFHFSQGSMAWFYVSEVSNDTAAGFASSG